MADVANTTSGNVDGTVVQAHDVGRDVNITNYGSPQRSVLLRVAAVAGAVLLALLVVVANLGSANKPADVSVRSSSTPPLASTPSSTAVTTSASTPAATTRQPAVAAAQPPPPRPQPPQTQQQQQPTVPPPPTYTKPANDGPGYLLPSNNDQKAIDFYDNQHHDAVMWDRHPPGTDPSYQPHWVREYSDTAAGVFRIRNEQVNRCLEPVSDPERGDHVVANVCSWGNEAQLWRNQNATQYASVKFGACLGVANNGS